MTKVTHFLPWLVAITVSATSCDYLLTSAPPDSEVFDAPLPGLTADELAAFARGDGEFERRFAPADGLGPIFNDVACGACHSGDGRGRPENALLRISRGGTPATEVGGPQIQDRAISGATPEAVPADVETSVRLPPPVFGVGLIEAIPTDQILANADPFDADGNGISGRPNFVAPPSWVPAIEPGGGAGPQLGRFSRKGQVSTLLQQVVEAYHQDMGITTEFLPSENVNPMAPGATLAADAVDDPEVPTSTVRAVVDYIRMLAPPAPGPDTPMRIRGKEAFDEIGCAGCHVPAFTTGPSSIAALENQTVTLYSDLLLHDLGDALADNRPDGLANGREWRTTPLWGLRVAREFLNGELFLLHDGRAHTVEEAILLHGGEAEDIIRAFEALSAEDRAAVLDFVESR